MLRLAQAASQAAAPGSAFHYASTPFDLLAEAVEHRLDRPFDDIVRVNVLEPLGMTDTTFDPSAALADRMAPVTVDLPSLAGIDGRALIGGYTGLRLAGGGLWSTASDILRFGRAMLRGGELDGERVLSPAFVQLMTREVTVAGLGAAEDMLRGEHYALGWGKPGPASPGIRGRFRTRRRHRHAPLGRPGARPRVRLPDRCLGARAPADQRGPQRRVRGPAVGSGP